MQRAVFAGTTMALAANDERIQHAPHYKFLLLNRDLARDHLRLQDGTIQTDYHVLRFLDAVCPKLQPQHRNNYNHRLRQIAIYRAYCLQTLGVSAWPIEPVRVSLFVAEYLMTIIDDVAPSEDPQDGDEGDDEDDEVQEPKESTSRRTRSSSRKAAEVVAVAKGDEPPKWTKKEYERAHERMGYRIQSYLNALEWARKVTHPLFANAGFWSTCYSPLADHAAIKSCVNSYTLFAVDDVSLHDDPEAHIWNDVLPQYPSTASGPGKPFELAQRAQWLEAQDRHRVANPVEEIPKLRWVYWRNPDGYFPPRSCPFVPDPVDEGGKAAAKAKKRKGSVVKDVSANAKTRRYLIADYGERRPMPRRPPSETIFGESWLTSKKRQYSYAPLFVTDLHVGGLGFPERDLPSPMVSMPQLRKKVAKTLSEEGWFGLIPVSEADAEAMLDEIETRDKRKSAGEHADDPWQEEAFTTAASLALGQLMPTTGLMNPRSPTFGEDGVLQIPMSPVGATIPDDVVPESWKEVSARPEEEDERPKWEESMVRPFVEAMRARYEQGLGDFLAAIHDAGVDPSKRLPSFVPSHDGTPTEQRAVDVFKAPGLPASQSLNHLTTTDIGGSQEIMDEWTIDDALRPQGGVAPIPPTEDPFAFRRHPEAILDYIRQIDGDLAHTQFDLSIRLPYTGFTGALDVSAVGYTWKEYTAWAARVDVPSLPIEPYRVVQFAWDNMDVAIRKVRDKPCDASEFMVGNLVLQFEWLRAHTAHLFNWGGFPRVVRQSLWDSRLIKNLVPIRADKEAHRLVIEGTSAINAHEEDEWKPDFDGSRRRRWRAVAREKGLPLKHPRNMRSDFLSPQQLPLKTAVAGDSDEEGTDSSVSTVNVGAAALSAPGIATFATVGIIPEPGVIPVGPPFAIPGPMASTSATAMVVDEAPQPSNNNRRPSLTAATTSGENPATDRFRTTISEISNATTFDIGRGGLALGAEIPTGTIQSSMLSTMIGAPGGQLYPSEQAFSGNDGGVPAQPPPPPSPTESPSEQARQYIRAGGAKMQMERWTDDAKEGAKLDKLGDREGVDDWIMATQTWEVFKDEQLRNKALEAIRLTQDGFKVKNLCLRHLRAWADQQEGSLWSLFRLYLCWTELPRVRVSPFPIEPTRITLWFLDTMENSTISDQEAYYIVDAFDHFRKQTYQFFHFGSFWPWCEDSLWCYDMVRSLISEPPERPAIDRQDPGVDGWHTALCPIQRRYWIRHASVKLLPLKRPMKRCTRVEMKERKRRREAQSDDIARELAIGPDHAEDPRPIKRLRAPSVPAITMGGGASTVAGGLGGMALRTEAGGTTTIVIAPPPIAGPSGTQAQAQPQAGPSNSNRATRAGRSTSTSHRRSASTSNRPVAPVPSSSKAPSSRASNKGKKTTIDLSNDSD